MLPYSKPRHAWKVMFEHSYVLALMCSEIGPMDNELENKALKDAVTLLQETHIHTDPTAFAALWTLAVTILNMNGWIIDMYELSAKHETSQNFVKVSALCDYVPEEGTVMRNLRDNEQLNKFLSGGW